MPSPYYADNLVTLYHGDCAELLPSISGVDLVVTSPPYNLGSTQMAGFGNYKAGQPRGGSHKWHGVKPNGIDYGDHDDAMSVSEYVAWQRAVLTLLWETLTDVGAIFYNHKPRVQADSLWLPLEVNPGLPIRQIVMWARSGGMNFAPTHYVPTHEWIIVFAKSAWRLKSKAASGVGDVWRIHQESNNPHPAPFPLGLPARAIETTAPKLVLDPFAGSGTTLRAATNAGVRAIGIEKSERYCELAARRLDQLCINFEEPA